MNKTEQQPFQEFNNLIPGVEEKGGWDNFYQKKYAEQLLHNQEMLPELMARPPLPEGHSYVVTVEGCEREIQQIKTLFFLHKSLIEHGYEEESLFMGLAHTLDYYGSVLVPMQEMIKVGEIDDAINLYQQPRHHHR